MKLSASICRVSFLLAALAALAGCPQPHDLTGTGMDMFAPVKMRLHPLSRLVMANGGGQVEAHLEFTDQMGDVTKGVGRVDLELLAYDDTALINHQGKRLDQWTADLATPQANKAAWDPITRTYVFRRDVPAAAGFTPGRHYYVVATCTLPNGQPYRDEALLTVK